VGDREHNGDEVEVWKARGVGKGNETQRGMRIVRGSDERKGETHLFPPASSVSLLLPDITRDFGLLFFWVGSSSGYL